MSDSIDIQRWIGGTGDDLRIDVATVSFACGPETDWFRDPRTGTVTDNAPIAVIAEGWPLTVSCITEPDLGATFDATGFFVHYDAEHWIKLAFERSPAGDGTMVTVRTAGSSDDCNHDVVGASKVRLRVTLDERSIALHAADADDPTPVWRLLRYGAHPSPQSPSVGLLVQSPTGPGSVGRFEAITIEHTTVADLRDGS